MYDGEVDALEPREARAVIETAESMSRAKEATVKLLLETGMRASEAAHLTADWLAPEREPPAIEVPAHEPCDCTQCTQQAEENLRRWAENESEDEDRPDPGTDEYGRLLEERRRRAWSPKSAAGERRIPVTGHWQTIESFVRDHDGLNAGRSGIWYRVSAVGDELDLPKPLSPHVLRHTAGTSWARNGMGLENLQGVMGHSSIENTQVYLHPTYDDDIGPAAEQAAENRGW